MTGPPLPFGVPLCVDRPKGRCSCEWQARPDLKGTAFWTLIFTGMSDFVIATEHGAGPWDPRMLHGGAPSGLIASIVQRFAE
jgi:hypothetical protein